MKYFIGHDHSLSSDDSRRAVVNFWRKNMHKYWFIMAPSYEFYISYLTKVKYFSLTVFSTYSRTSMARISLGP